MTHNNILDIVHFSIIHIFLPQFLTDSLINIIIFELGRICVHLGTLDTRFRDYCWYLWVGEGFRCLVHDGWLKVIAVVRPNIPLQILHFPGKLVRHW